MNSQNRDLSDPSPKYKDIRRVADCFILDWLLDHCTVITGSVLTLAALRVVRAQAKEASFALVAARPFDVSLAAALTCHHAKRRVGVAVTHPSILRTIRITITSCGADT